MQASDEARHSGGVQAPRHAEASVKIVDKKRGSWQLLFWQLLCSMDECFFFGLFA